MRGNRLLKIIDFYIGVPLVWLLGFLCKKPATLDGAFKKILLIKLSAMGDSVVLIPAVRALRKKFPDATITVICTKINKDIFQLCPYINKTIVFDVKKIINPFYSLKLFGKEHYDAAIDFDQWLRVSPVLSFLSKAKIRLGFETDLQFRHYSYTHPVKHSKDRHELECFFDIIRPLSVESSDDKLEFW
ncbi:MAG: glycosyltransferase family 9 protein, partial [Endomicrobiia bacterium]|nr:glycosyltransferase family 9 protein [Endomicrobiia bacterium]